MDNTDTALGYAGVAVLCLFAGCIVRYILKESCIHKTEPLLNNGDDSLSEV
jgi:hypothetical protein